MLNNQRVYTMISAVYSIPMYTLGDAWELMWEIRSTPTTNNWKTWQDTLALEHCSTDRLSHRFVRGLMQRKSSHNGAAELSTKKTDDSWQQPVIGGFIGYCIPCLTHVEHGHKIPIYDFLRDDDRRSLVVTLFACFGGLGVSTAIP